jgi:hypothetical protein
MLFETVNQAIRNEKRYGNPRKVAQKRLWQRFRPTTAKNQPKLTFPVLDKYKAMMSLWWRWATLSTTTKEVTWDTTVNNSPNRQARLWLERIGVIVTAIRKEFLEVLY